MLRRRPLLVMVPLALSLAACADTSSEKGGSDGTADGSADGTADGTADGAADGESGEPEAENSLPSVTSVDLGPEAGLDEPAFEDSVLVATVRGAFDADGDPMRYHYAWSVNGVVLSSATSDRLTGADFDKGDVVQVSVTPDDGLGLGSSCSSATLTIQNTPPTAPVVSISPASPIEGDALVCAIAAPATDLDGDTPGYTVAWVVDGLAYPSPEGDTLVDDTLVGDTVPAGETAAGETWACTVTANDGSASSPAGESAVMVVHPDPAPSRPDAFVELRSGVELVRIAASTFDMGCTPGQSSCRSDESPVTTTTLTHDFYISRTEVTQAQFQAVMGYNPSRLSSCGSDCPVDSASWHESAAFANAISAAVGLAPCYTCSGSGRSVTCSPPTSVYSCAGYRLPTEAEWEGAARCGEDTLYAGSDTVGDVAWYYDNSVSTTHPVAGLAPNACGLFDMSGNVWEWVNDWYDSAAYSGGAATDPIGPTDGAERGLRGGGLSFGPEYLRVSRRYSVMPSWAAVTLGIRLARTAP